MNAYQPAPLLERPAPSAPRDPRKLWLDRNENTDPEWRAHVREVAATLTASDWVDYPDLAPLYDRLARSLNVGVQNLLLAPGSDGCIRAVFEAFVRPGDVVLRPEPTFAMYGVYCRIYGAREIALDYHRGVRHLELPRLIETILAERPRLVCLPHPDSPSGATRIDLLDVVDACAQVGAILLVDEAYYPFHETTLARLHVAGIDHVVVTRSVGKAWGAAGARVGYAIASVPLISAMRKIRPMYEIGAASAALFLRLLDHERLMRISVGRILEGKREFLERMLPLGFPILEGAGNFMHVHFGVRGPKVHAALEPLCLYRRDFNHPSLAGFSRFTAAPWPVLEPVWRAIREAANA